MRPRLAFPHEDEVGGQGLALELGLGVDEAARVIFVFFREPPPGRFSDGDPSRMLA